MCALLLFASLRSFLGFRSSKLRVGSSCQWPRATGTWSRSQVHPVARGGTIAPRERVIFFRALYFIVPRRDCKPPRSAPWRALGREHTSRIIWVRHFSQPKPLSARWTVSVGRSLKAPLRDHPHPPSRTPDLAQQRLPGTDKHHGGLHLS